MITQYMVTGRAVGFADDAQPFQFIEGSWPQHAKFSRLGEEH